VTDRRRYAAGFFLAAGFVTLPDRMQRVHARTRRLTPPITDRTVFRLRSHFRFVTLWAWLTRCPDIGVFPQN